MTQIAKLLSQLPSSGRTELCHIPPGYDALIVQEISKEIGKRPLLCITLDDRRVTALAEQIQFFAPSLKILRFPAWDCLPYDRISPTNDIMAQRLATLAQLSSAIKEPTIILTTVNAISQRLIARSTMQGANFYAKANAFLDTKKLTEFLEKNGFNRVGTVIDAGDYAIRGGLIDIFPPTTLAPLRLDFFGNRLESIRSFDIETQRSHNSLLEFSLCAANEVLLNPDSISRFRKNYAALFHGVDLNDPLYESIINGRRYQGMEHWLPLFHDKLETLFDYLEDALIILDHEVEPSMRARRDQVKEFYDARLQAQDKSSLGTVSYKPVPPENLFLSEKEWETLQIERSVLSLSPFESPSTNAICFSARQGRNFVSARTEANINVYETVKDHTETLRKAGKRVHIACWTTGSRERLQPILADHNIKPMAIAENWAEAQSRDLAIVNLVLLGLESGFETDNFVIIAEQDILGDRLVRRTRKARKASDILTEFSSLGLGDLIVHIDHGIGRFEGLKTIEVQGAPHDCLFLMYADNNRLFLPVENIDLITRFGSDDQTVLLDRLGSSAWQARKAKLKQRLHNIAEGLIKIAAARELRSGVVLEPPSGAYDEFCAKFPYEETEDQLNAIDAVIDDFHKGRPMDRLVCGDVGFGKTEIALRAAFIAAINGKQVAVVVPTTLLARQHFASFSTRFEGLPLRTEQLSRLVTPKQAEKIRDHIKSGDIDIVVGTHALLSSHIKFRDLGLLIIDEEQHFGVKHKERLKELRSDVHVLTLTATPIPRTLQLALTGLRELSLIATPPLDRLAVRSYISPYDPLVIRETLLREHYRGGQSFYVAPRISDLDELAGFLREEVPEIKFRTAHGRMAPTELEDIMSGFYDRKFDVLLSTTIVESGLDIPTANTLIIHRADMFGLAQLYQLRGRVGRAKIRAYALFTTPARQKLTQQAENRLKVLQSLDHLGAGFSLASHDLDLRGAGNLLGEEQSGHIKEVGYALYQSMLEETVAQLRSGGLVETTAEKWSPQLNIGTAVLIPENYISDLQLRLGLYRRLADLQTQEELDNFTVEIHDRFGKPPEEVCHLIEIVSIKMFCRTACIASLDTGIKGAVIGFHNNEFPKPERLINWIHAQGKYAKLRPDMKLVVIRDWDSAEDRLKGARKLAQTLVQLATKEN